VIARTSLIAASAAALYGCCRSSNGMPAAIAALREKTRMASLKVKLKAANTFSARPSGRLI
jgi:hypothetical protein